MLTNALCKSFQHLRVTGNGKILGRFCSTNTSKVSINSTLFYKPTNDENKSIYEPNLRLSFLRSRNLDFDLPQQRRSIGEIGEFPLTNLRIGEPPIIRQNQEDSISEKSIDLPAHEQIIEKRAERMIVIRRRKMRRHKLRKLRKRMKFLWSKIRQRREMKKEKAFHALLIGKIKKAEAFDAKAFVESRFAILDHVRLPNRYRGVKLPEAQIREFLEKDRAKQEKKFNKPRLTL